MPDSTTPDALFSAAMKAVESACEVCGAALLTGLLGDQCPRCLMNLASSTGIDEDLEDRDDLLHATQVRSFGDYELLEEVARGGMGVVYRARQRSLGREVAVKMILAGELAGEKALRMFQNEAQAAANLHHPNIVPVYESGELELQPYFTMRFVPDRRNIAQWAAEHRGQWRAIAAAVAQVARAVEHAHERGVLHRDLKPTNILWDHEAGPQVTDFGLARLLNTKDAAITGSSIMAGSPSYMAPEQVKGRDITTATDVYGLGAVLYELLTGRPPFHGRTVVETARQVIEERPATPSTDVPRDLRVICLKCLSKRATDRYHSATTLAEDLESFSRGEPVSAVPLSPLERLTGWARRKPRQAVLTGMTLLSIFGGLAGALWQWQQAERAYTAEKKSLEHLRWQEIGRWLENGESSRALAYLATLIRTQPDRWQAVMYAMSIVSRSSFPILVGTEIMPPVALSQHACLSPDGTWLAAACEDKTVRIWEASTGRELKKLPQSSLITALAAATSPVALAIATEDGALRIHRSFSAEPILLSRQVSGPIASLLFSADGSTLMARSAQHVELWRTQAPGQPAHLISMTGGIKDAEISLEGSRVLLWDDTHAAVHDISTGRELLRVQAEERVRKAALSADGGTMAIIGTEFSAHTWEVDDGRPLAVIRSPHSALLHLALDRTGRRLTLSFRSCQLTVYDTESGLAVSPPMTHQYDISSLRASPDGSRTLSHGTDDAFHVWDAQTGRQVWSAALSARANRGGAVSCSYDGSRVLAEVTANSVAQECLTVWQASHRSEPQTHPVEGQRDYNSSSISPDGKLGALGLYPGNRFHLYELDTGRVVMDHVTEGHVYIHLFSPDLSRCYVFTANGWLYGWDVKTGKALWEPRQQPGKIRPADISPDGTRLVAGHTDGHVRVYDTATGDLVQVLDHPGEVKSLRFAPDRSGRFVSSSTDGLAHVWDVLTGQKLQTFAGHTHTILATAWSPDSRYIATASFDSTARIWNVQTGLPAGSPMVHLTWLSHLEFSPDGTRLATACRDGTARLWHPFTSQPASPPLQQGQTCQTVRFTRDGACFVVQDMSGFRFWDTLSAEPVTMHHPEPLTGGLGMDSPSYRAIMSPGGDRIFLGASINEGTLWKIDQPRGSAPAWFADLLEALALVQLDDQGTTHRVSPEQLARIKQQIQSSPGDGLHEKWARRVLGISAP